MKNCLNIHRCVALSIVVMVLFELGCQREDRTDEKRITVALPQWFSPCHAWNH